MLISLEQFLMSLLIFTFRDIPLPGLLRDSPLRQACSTLDCQLESVDLWLPTSSLTISLWTSTGSCFCPSLISYGNRSTPVLHRKRSILRRECRPAVVEMEEEAPEPTPMSCRPVSARAKSAVGALGVLSQAKS
jgi:hypothetical protein